MKKVLYIFIILIVIITSGSMIFKISEVSEGYDVRISGDDVSVKGDLTSDKEYRFHTYIQLGDEVPLSSSIVELSLYSQTELDKDTNIYVLKNPRLEVTPIGCEQYDKQQEYIDGMNYSGNYQFGVNPNQSFNQTMPVKYAKLLLNNKNIKVTDVTSPSSQTKINSIRSLRWAKNDNDIVALKYNNLAQSFTQWYSIKFNLTSEDEGIFSIN